eukprot:Selendium_serpulae@DN7191_c0_g1_i1.p1
MIPSFFSSDSCVMLCFCVCHMFILLIALQQALKQRLSRVSFCFVNAHDSLPQKNRQYQSFKRQAFLRDWYNFGCEETTPKCIECCACFNDSVVNVVRVVEVPELF